MFIFAFAVQTSYCHVTEFTADGKKLAGEKLSQEKQRGVEMTMTHRMSFLHKWNDGEFKDNPTSLHSTPCRCPRARG
jgi:hypothetical protein